MAVFTPYIAFAQPNLGVVLPPKPSNVPTKFSTVQQAISTIFDFVIILAGVIFIILILIGGIQYLTAAGNEEGTGKAKKLIVDGIIGLAITLAAWAIGIFILRQVGFNVSGGGAGITLPRPWSRSVNTPEDLPQALADCNGGTLSPNPPPLYPFFVNCR